MLADKVVTAQEAYQRGFTNGILTNLPDTDFFDPGLVPVIPKLLKGDPQTVQNCMEQINLSKNNDKIDEVTRREAQALVETWADPSFMKKMKAYMKQTLDKKKAKL